MGFGQLSRPARNEPRSKEGGEKRPDSRFAALNEVNMLGKGGRERKTTDNSIAFKRTA